MRYVIETRSKTIKRGRRWSAGIYGPRAAVFAGFGRNEKTASGYAKVRLKDIFSPENVVVDIRSKDRDGVISELLDAVIEQVPMEKEKLKEILIQREDQSATAMNGMVAVPHGRIPKLESFVLGVGRSREGVDFGAEDSKTRIFFLLVAPSSDTVNHLKILARIARLCRNESFKESILEADTAEQIYQSIVDEEEKII